MPDLCVSVMLLAAALATPSFAVDYDWNQVPSALGKPGPIQPGGVYKIGLPRTDLNVTLDGVAGQPGLALGGWLAFEGMRSQAMVMVDLVLTEDEVNPVMKKLQDGGIDITALYNHLLRAASMTLYTHVHGQGDPVKLATALRDGLALSKTPIRPLLPVDIPRCAVHGDDAQRHCPPRCRRSRRRWWASS